MVNVLVFPAHTETALEIRDALKDLKTVRLFGGACSEGLADFVFETCFHNLPAVDSPLFADSLNAVIDSNHIDYIFPVYKDGIIKINIDAAVGNIGFETRAERTVYKHAVMIDNGIRSFSAKQR